MAEAVVVAGAVLVKTGTGSANALENLGYSINGIQIRERVYTLDVPGDQNGGDEGPPIDRQYLGEVDLITMELSKYDVAVFAKLTPKLLGGTAGQTATPGTLIFGASKYYRLLLTGAAFTRNYIGATLIGEPIEFNAGTKFSRLRIEWECHAISGVKWNSTTS